MMVRTNDSYDNSMNRISMQSEESPSLASQSLVSTEFSHRVARDIVKIVKVFAIVMALCTTASLITAFALAGKNSDYYASVTAMGENLESTNDLCTEVDLGSEEEIAKCEEACMVAECCFIPSGSEGSCVQSKDICIQYEAVCHRFFDESFSSKTIVSYAANSLEKACSVESVGSLSGYIDCQRLCLPALCCITEDEEESCRDNNPDTCPGYTPCKQLFRASPGGSTPDTTTDDTTPDTTDTTTDGTTQNTTETPTSEEPPEITPTLKSSTDDIATACSKQSIQTPSGHSQCQSLCAPHACCFNSTCTADCDTYTPCKILPEYADRDAHPSLSQICTAEKIDTFEGELECEKECINAFCCFAEGPANCVKSEADHCANYDACAILYHDREESGKLTANACAKESVLTPEGYSTCEEECENGACCFDTGEEGCADELDYCADYEPCKILPRYGLREVDEALVETCAEGNIATSEGLEACEDMCISAFCCFAEGPANCMEVEAELCTDYEPCKVLYRDDIVALEEKCDEENVTTMTGKKECEDLCIKALCCFADGEASCIDSRPEFCEDYAPCEILGSGTIEEACGEESLNTTEGRDLCQMKCSVSSCCFSSEDSCAEVEKEFCEDYEGCRMFFEEIS